MKYKFSLNEKVKGIIEWELEHYNESKRELETAKDDMMPTMTQSVNGMPGSHEASRQTEQVALKITTSDYINRLEKSVHAIDSVLDKLDDTDKQLVALVYWQKAYNIIGAGMKVGLSQAQSYRRINGILCLIAVELGFATP